MIIKFLSCTKSFHYLTYGLPIANAKAGIVDELKISLSNLSQQNIEQLFGNVWKCMPALLTQENIVAFISHRAHKQLQYCPQKYIHDIVECILNCKQAMSKQEIKHLLLDQSSIPYVGGLFDIIWEHYTYYQE